MRPQFAAMIFLVAVAFAALAIFISKALYPPPISPTPVNLSAAPTIVPVSPRTEISNSPTPAATNITESNPETPAVKDPDHAEQVRARVAELTTLSMNNDADSLKTIWSELSNPDKEIRAGALEAVVQFGDRSVVPDLRKLAAQTSDSAEKASILEAADHLDLPSLSDLRSGQQTNTLQPTH